MKEKFYTLWNKKSVDITLEKEKDFLQIVLIGQILNIGVLFLTFILYLIFGKLFPDFSLKENWLKTDDIISSLQEYWFLFAWVGGVSILSHTKIGSFTKARQIFGLNIITSILAGLWEEIGYRGLFIFTAMISIFLVNFFFKWVIIFVLLILMGFLIFKIFEKWFLRLIVLALGISFVILILKWNIVQDPLYWIYEHITFPILSFCSVKVLNPVLYNPEYSFLFIAGAISANAKFRDGHKYQGWFGYLNSWVVGFVLLHAMIFHGLLVAIIIHASYDLLIGVIRFVKRALFNGEYKLFRK